MSDFKIGKFENLEERSISGTTKTPFSMGVLGPISLRRTGEAYPMIVTNNPDFLDSDLLSGAVETFNIVSEGLEPLVDELGNNIVWQV